MSKPHKTPYKYPWKDLSIGDSFWVNRPIQSLSQPRSDAQMKFGVVIQGKSSSGGTRFTRTK